MQKRYVILIACLVALVGIAAGCLLCFVWAKPYLPGGEVYEAYMSDDYAKLYEIQA